MDLAGRERGGDLLSTRFRPNGTMMAVEATICARLTRNHPVAANFTSVASIACSCRSFPPSINLRRWHRSRNVREMAHYMADSCPGERKCDVCSKGVVIIFGKTSIPQQKELRSLNLSCSQKGLEICGVRMRGLEAGSLF